MLILNSVVISKVGRFDTQVLLIQNCNCWFASINLDFAQKKYLACIQIFVHQATRICANEDALGVGSTVDCR